MESRIDLDSIGTQLPYNVPDGFFTSLEEKIVSNIPKQHQHPDKRQDSQKWLRFGVYSAIAAATIAMLIILKPTSHTINPTEDSFNKIETAFNHLSPEDQNYLLTIYEEDIFMNE